MKLNLASLLKNQKILYVLGFLATFQLMGYLMLNEINSALMLILVGFLTSFFTKNMIIIFFVAMLVANISATSLYKMHGYSLYEGLTNKTNKSKEEEEEEEEEQEKEIQEGLETKNKDHKDKDKDKCMKDCKGKLECIDNCKKPKSGFQNRLAPSKFNKDDNEGEDDDDEKPSLDYASTVESAYDNLDKILDSDALKSMSNDSQRLIEKQQKLMDNMKNIQPMMKDVTKFLKGFDMDKMTDMFSQFSSSDESTPEENN